MMAGDRANLWCVFKTQKHSWTSRFRNAVEGVTCRILLLLYIEDFVVRPYYENKMITVPTGLIELTRTSPPSREPVELVLRKKTVYNDELFRLKAISILLFISVHFRCNNLYFKKYIFLTVSIMKMIVCIL